MASQIKDIPGYEGLYQISDNGIVYSLKYKTEIGNHPSRNGYLMTDLYINGKRKTWRTHQLVALAFIGPANGLDVNHKNGIKTDNRLDNLEHCSRSKNIAHAYANGLRSPKYKFSPSDVENIKIMRRNGGTYRSIASEYKCAISCVWTAINCPI